MPMDTNLGRVVMYDEGLPLIMMHGLFIVWSFNQVIVPLLSKSLWSLKLRGWGHTLGFYYKVKWHFDHMVLQDPVTN